jgi:hypothetical protein
MHICEVNDVLQSAAWIHYLPQKLGKVSEELPLPSDGSNTLQKSTEISEGTVSENYDSSNSYQTSAYTAAVSYLMFI